MTHRLQDSFFQFLEQKHVSGFHAVLNLLYFTFDLTNFNVKMSETGNSKFGKESFIFRHRLEYFIFSRLKQWRKTASEKSLGRAALILYTLLYYLLRICRKIVKINLEFAFPKLSSIERKKIARENYRWFARLRSQKNRLFWRLTRWQSALSY